MDSASMAFPLAASESQHLASTNSHEPSISTPDPPRMDDAEYGHRAQAVLSSVASSPTSFRQESTSPDANNVFLEDEQQNEVEPQPHIGHSTPMASSSPRAGNVAPSRSLMPAQAHETDTSNAQLAPVLIFTEPSPPPPVPWVLTACRHSQSSLTPSLQPLYHQVLTKQQSARDGDAVRITMHSCHGVAWASVG